MASLCKRIFNTCLIVQVLLQFVTQGFAQSADLVFINGNIFTSDTSRLYVKALAVKDSKVIAIGANQEIEKLVTTKTRRIDLHGATVVPGFNDAHDHPVFLAPIGKYFSDPISKPEGLSRSMVLDSLSMLVAKAAPGEWITGPIGLKVLNDTSMRRSLDMMAPNNPVYLQAWWGHGSLVNKRALEAIDISDCSVDPPGGWYIKNGKGQIVAMHENAQASLWITFTLSNMFGAQQSLRKISLLQLQHGITTVQYMGTGVSPLAPAELFSDITYDQRIRLIKWPTSTTMATQQHGWRLPTASPNQLFKLSGVKYLVDGTPIEGNALKTKTQGHDIGRFNYPVDTLRKILQIALAGNEQLVLHAVGDSAVLQVLSLMKTLAAPGRWIPKRVRIEHNAATLSTEMVNDIVSMGILLMHTPKYAHASEVSSLLRAGVLLGIAPDGTVNPFVDLFHITNLQTNARENLSREQAVIAYTYTNAYAEFEETNKGRLIPGMLADLTVLSQNIFAIPADKLTSTKSLLTLVNGKIVYKDKVFK